MASINIGGRLCGCWYGASTGRHAVHKGYGQRKPILLHLPLWMPVGCNGGVSCVWFIWLLLSVHQSPGEEYTLAAAV